MRFSLFVILGISLTACMPTAELPPPVGLAYLAHQPICLNVARVEVIKKYQSSSVPPHVENSFPVPPVAMIQQWVQDRLLPVGKTGHAVVTIEDASVIEIPLKGTPGFKGMFMVDQSEQYDANISIKVEIFDDLGNLKGSACARTKATRTVGENLTLGQRRKVWIIMMEKIMNNLNAELDLNIKKYLGAYLSS